MRCLFLNSWTLTAAHFNIFRKSSKRWKFACEERRSGKNARTKSKQHPGKQSEHTHYIATKRYFRDRSKRTQLLRDEKIFANSTKLLNSKRSSITLLPAGAAAAFVLEPKLEKAACKMLSIFIFVRAQTKKMRRIATHLNHMNYKLNHLSSHTDDTIHILGNENLKQQEQMKTILNYTAGNFGTVMEAINNLEYDMEQVQQAQVCNHKRSEVITFFLKAQSVINNVSFALVSHLLEVQSFKYELKKFNNKFREAFQEMSNGRMPSKLIEPDKLQRILQPLRFHHKRCQYHSSMLVSTMNLSYLEKFLLGTRGSS